MFFTKSTDNSGIDIPSKLSNIYNFDEINQSSRKELIVSRILTRKIVTMIEEEGAKNFIYSAY